MAAAQLEGSDALLKRLKELAVAIAATHFELEARKRRTAKAKPARSLFSFNHKARQASVAWLVLPCDPRYRC